MKFVRFIYWFMVLFGRPFTTDKDGNPIRVNFQGAYDAARILSE